MNQTFVWVTYRVISCAPYFSVTGEFSEGLTSKIQMRLKAGGGCHLEYLCRLEHKSVYGLKPKDPGLLNATKALHDNNRF